MFHLSSALTLKQLGSPKTYFHTNSKDKCPLPLNYVLTFPCVAPSCSKRQLCIGMPCLWVQAKFTLRNMETVSLSVFCLQCLLQIIPTAKCLYALINQLWQTHNTMSLAYDDDLCSSFAKQWGELRIFIRIIQIQCHPPPCQFNSFILAAPFPIFLLLYFFL
jgi:hypothetical protein